ncbi:tetratricopeptide repeat protein [Kitasatospora sp. NPDC002965]|uniref:tetratricopeptide repeat protein n=1 Tax=Kitasatospora sp. NPDC002965 TaxID=3154775 RepID=UPI0033B54BEB
MDDEQHGTALAQAVRLREEGTRQACEQLIALSDHHPEDAAIAYQAAWAHDALGLEAEAVPCYERALGAAGLSESERHGALLGLGSTYRVLGRYESSLRTLRRGLEEFPGDAALRTFLAMALYNVGESREAVRTLLQVTGETSADPGVRKYRRAVGYYADHLDETQ